MVRTFFWLCVGFVLYIYFGYTLLLLILSKLRLAPPLQRPDVLTSILLIIPAYPIIR